MTAGWIITGIGGAFFLFVLIVTWMDNHPSKEVQENRDAMERIRKMSKNQYHHDR